MWSTIPQPWRAPISVARSIRSTSSIRSPSRATGLPRSNSTFTSCGSSGASSGRVTSWKTSSGGGAVRSSIALPSEERPQRLSSIEYGETSLPPFSGIPWSRAYWSSSSRPILQSRTGASTFSSGFSVAIVASRRTWSLPLPVHPWAIVSQPCSAATSTALAAISGLARAVKSG